MERSPAAAARQPAAVRLLGLVRRKRWEGQAFRLAPAMELARPAPGMVRASAVNPGVVPRSQRLEAPMGWMGMDEGRPPHCLRLTAAAEVEVGRRRPPPSTGRTAAECRRGCRGCVAAAAEHLCTSTGSRACCWSAVAAVVGSSAPPRPPPWILMCGGRPRRRRTRRGWVAAAVEHRRTHSHFQYSDDSAVRPCAQVFLFGPAYVSRNVCQGAPDTGSQCSAPPSPPQCH